MRVSCRVGFGSGLQVGLSYGGRIWVSEYWQWNRGNGVGVAVGIRVRGKVRAGGRVRVMVRLEAVSGVLLGRSHEICDVAVLVRWHH